MLRICPMSPDLAEVLHKNGYICIREGADGQVLGVAQMMTTWALCYGLDEMGQEGRYCYEHAIDCIEALGELDHRLGIGRPPPVGPWIKHKGRGVTDNNPALMGAY